MMQPEMPANRKGTTTDARTVPEALRFPRLAFISMQFQDEPVRQRANPHDDLADDMDVVPVLGVDGAIADGAGCEE